MRETADLVIAFAALASALIGGRLNGRLLETPMLSVAFGARLTASDSRHIDEHASEALHLIARVKLAPTLFEDPAQYVDTLRDAYEGIPPGHID